MSEASDPNARKRKRDTSRSGSRSPEEQPSRKRAAHEAAERPTLDTMMERLLTKSRAASYAGVAWRAESSPPSEVWEKTWRRPADDLAAGRTAVAYGCFCPPDALQTLVARGREVLRWTLEDWTLFFAHHIHHYPMSGGTPALELLLDTLLNESPSSSKQELVPRAADLVRRLRQLDRMLHTSGGMIPFHGVSKRRSLMELLIQRYLEPPVRQSVVWRLVSAESGDHRELLFPFHTFPLELSLAAHLPRPPPGEPLLLVEVPAMFAGRPDRKEAARGPAPKSGYELLDLLGAEVLRHLTQEGVAKLLHAEAKELAQVAQRAATNALHTLTWGGEVARSRYNLGDLPRALQALTVDDDHWRHSLEVGSWRNDVPRIGRLLAQNAGTLRSLVLPADYVRRSYLEWKAFSGEEPRTFPLPVLPALQSIYFAPRLQTPHDDEVRTRRSPPQPEVLHRGLDAPDLGAFLAARMPRLVSMKGFPPVWHLEHLLGESGTAAAAWPALAELDLRLYSCLDNHELLYNRAGTPAIPVRLPADAAQRLPRLQVVKLVLHFPVVQSYLMSFYGHPRLESLDLWITHVARLFHGEEKVVAPTATALRSLRLIGAQRGVWLDTPLPSAPHLVSIIADSAIEGAGRWNSIATAAPRLSRLYVNGVSLEVAEEGAHSPLPMAALSILNIGSTTGFFSSHRHVLRLGPHSLTRLVPNLAFLTIRGMHSGDLSHPTLHELQLPHPDQYADDHKRYSEHLAGTLSGVKLPAVSRLVLESGLHPYHPDRVFSAQVVPALREVVFLAKSPNEALRAMEGFTWVVSAPHQQPPTVLVNSPEAEEQRLVALAGGQTRQQQPPPAPPRALQQQQQQRQAPLGDLLLLVPHRLGAAHQIINLPQQQFAQHAEAYQGVLSASPLRGVVVRFGADTPHALLRALAQAILAPDATTISDLLSRTAADGDIGCGKTLPPRLLLAGLAQQLGMRAILSTVISPRIARDLAHCANGDLHVILSRPVSEYLGSF